MHSKCRERTVTYFPVPSVCAKQLYQEYSKTSRCLPFLKRSLRLSLKGAAETPRWASPLLPAEYLYLSISVFPLETSIFLERFPLERER